MGHSPAHRSQTAAYLLPFVGVVQTKISGTRKGSFFLFFFYFPKFFWQFRGDSISQCTLSRQMTRTFLWARLFDPCLRKFLSVSDHMRTGKLRDATPSCEMANRSGWIRTFDLQSLVKYFSINFKIRSNRLI